MAIEFGRQVCGSLAEASAREWLVTDGLGGYAMGTVAGLRTRRYHGLLMVAGAAANGNGDAGVSRRMLGLAALDADARRRRPPASGSRPTSGRAASSIPPGTASSSRSRSTHGIPRWRWVIGDIVVRA